MLRCVWIDIVSDSTVSDYALVRFANYTENVKPVSIFEFDIRKEKALKLANRFRMNADVTIFADSVNSSGVLDFSALIEK